MDTRKTTVVKIIPVRESGVVPVLRRICREAQDRASREMALPTDPHDRIIAINVRNTVFDRIDEALERLAADSSGVIPIMLEGENHE